MKHEAGWSAENQIEINGKIRISISEWMDEDRMSGSFKTKLLQISDDTLMIKFEPVETTPEHYIDIKGDC